MQKNGFTLAEVLITIGIIGLVAAMTLPALIQNYQEKVTVNKVKKMYSLLQQAYLMNKAKDEVILHNTQTSDAAAASEIAAIFVPHLKILKDCGTTATGCDIQGSYKTKDATNTKNYAVGGFIAYRVLLVDGSCLWFRRTQDSKHPAMVMYDVNGKYLPNQLGNDLFMFVVQNDTVVPSGNADTRYPFPTACSNANADGYGCTAWVIAHENLDYLKCSGLQLNGPKIKCN